MYDLKLHKFTTHFHLHIEDENEFLYEKDIINIIDNFELVFSRFKEDSILSKLNKSRELIVPDIFLKLLKKNIYIFNYTNGYFNPSVSIDKFWYSNNYYNNSNISDLNKNIIIDGNNVKLIWDLYIDFWASWKWFLVDIIVSFLNSRWVKKFFINFWWDIFVNWYINNNNLSVWIIDPFDEINNLFSINLSNESISTSWIYKRKWVVNNKNFHHILNPKTNSNNDEIISVSIIWNDCTFTDSIATSIIAMGLTQWIDFLNKNNINAIIITTNKKTIFTNNINKNYKII